MEASRVYREGSLASRVPEAPRLLAMAVTLLKRTTPTLLETYYAAFVDEESDDLYIQRCEPHPSICRVDEPFEGFCASVKANFELVESMEGTHCLLVGLDPYVKPLPALYRRSDVEWAKVRMGWPERKVAKKMLNIVRIRAIPEVRAGGIDYSLHEASDNFRMHALAMRPPAVCSGCRRATELLSCAGCGKAWYCSRECQRSDWPAHKDACPVLRHADAFPSTRTLRADIADV